jgi:hypothetical protein
MHILSVNDDLLNKLAHFLASLRNWLESFVELGTTQGHVTGAVELHVHVD